MNFHVTAGQRHLPGRIRRPPYPREDFLPDALLAPAREPILDGLCRPILIGAVLPAAPNFLHIRDPAQNPSVVGAFGTLLIGRQMRLNFQPLFVAKLEGTSKNSVVCEFVRV
jgi:hypothetical protein